MTDAGALDPRAILAALGVDEVERISPVGGGWDTALWRVAHGGAVSALRLFRPEQAGTCRLEVAAMALAAAGGIPVPEIRAVGTWRERPVLLLAWCPGRQLFALLRQRPGRARALGAEFGRTQARIHALAVPADSSLAGRDWVDWAGPEPALRARLERLGHRRDALLHLDYHPLNVMAGPSGIAGVLDWSNAAAGDPRADVARTLSILRLAAISPWMSRMRVATVLRPFTVGYRRGYEEVSGPLADLDLFHAWAAAVMVRDLAPKAGRPGVWLTARQLDWLRRRASLWKQRAGIEG